MAKFGLHSQLFDLGHVLQLSVHIKNVVNLLFSALYLFCLLYRLQPFIRSLFSHILQIAYPKSRHSLLRRLLTRVHIWDWIWFGGDIFGWVHILVRWNWRPHNLTLWSFERRKIIVLLLFRSLLILLDLIRLSCVVFRRIICSFSCIFGVNG